MVSHAHPTQRMLPASTTWQRPYHLGGAVVNTTITDLPRHSHAPSAPRPFSDQFESRRPTEAKKEERRKGLSHWRVPSEKTCSRAVISTCTIVFVTTILVVAACVSGLANKMKDLAGPACEECPVCPQFNDSLHDAFSRFVNNEFVMKQVAERTAQKLTELLRRRHPEDKKSDGFMGGEQSPSWSRPRTTTTKINSLGPLSNFLVTPSDPVHSFSSLTTHAMPNLRPTAETMTTLDDTELRKLASEVPNYPDDIDLAGGYQAIFDDEIEKMRRENRSEADIKMRPREHATFIAAWKEQLAVAREVDRQKHLAKAEIQRRQQLREQAELARRVPLQPEEEEDEEEEEEDDVDDGGKSKKQVDIGR